MESMFSIFESHVLRGTLTALTIVCLWKLIVRELCSALCETYGLVKDLREKYPGRRKDV